MAESKKLTPEEKAARHVKGVVTRGNNLVAKMAATLREMVKLREEWEKYRVQGFKDFSAGKFGPEFPKYLFENRHAIDTLLAKEMGRIGAPGARRLPNPGAARPMEEQVGLDLGLITPGLEPDELKAKQDAEQEKWVAEEAARAEKRRLLGIASAGIDDALSENFWPEDPPAIDHVIRWGKEKEDVVLSRELVEEKLRERGYLDPNVRY